jgi:hypothetical protein
MRGALDLREAGGGGDVLHHQADGHEVQGQARRRALQGTFGRDGVCRELHELLRRLWGRRLRDHDDHNVNHDNNDYNHATALRRESPVEPVLQRRV